MADTDIVILGAAATAILLAAKEEQANGTYWYQDQLPDGTAVLRQYQPPLITAQAQETARRAVMAWGLILFVVYGLALLAMIIFAVAVNS